MTERERILEEMIEVIADKFFAEKLDELYTDNAVYNFAELAAKTALEIIERPLDSTKETYSRICNCGQSGYDENGPHSNHPHREGCPQYTGKYD